MAALMKRRVIQVFTHDSIGLGEDGPTHQAVEHAPSLRLIPNLEVWRPADAVETVIAWQAAIERRDGPTALLLSRQSLPAVARSELDANLIRRGGYVLRETDDARATLLATGSELGLAIETQRLLGARGLSVRVVSMPCTSRFDGQSSQYRSDVLPRHLPTIAIEASQPDLWHKYVGLDGAVVGISSFGESAPGPDVYRHFALTPEHVAEVVARTVSAFETRCDPSH
jgi:transketolase